MNNANNQSNQKPMKTPVKVIVIVLCVALLFFSGYGLGMMKDIKMSVRGDIGANANQAQTVAPTRQTAPATTPAAPETTSVAPETTPTQTAPSETAPSAQTDSTEEIVQKVSDAMNKLKSERNFTGRKSEKTVINIKECSAAALTNVLNTVCRKVAGEKLSTYEFKNGSAVGIGDDGKERNDGKALSPKEALPPKGNDFVLSASGVKEATAVRNGDSTTYTIKLISETSTVDSAPAVNSASIGFLNLGGFSIPTVSITRADINYPESVITVTVDSQGRVTSLKVDQPMDGTMGAKIAIVSGDVVFDGGNFETWEFTY